MSPSLYTLLSPWEGRWIQRWVPSSLVTLKCRSLGTRHNKTLVLTETGRNHRRSAREQIKKQFNDNNNKKPNLVQKVWEKEGEKKKGRKEGGS